MKLKPFSEIILYERFKGLSSYFSIGKNKGWRVEKDGPSLRFDLGWFSFSFMSIDIQNLIKGLLEELKDKDLEDKRVEGLSTTISKKEQEVLDLQKRIALQDNEINNFCTNIAKLNDKMSDLNDEIDDQEEMVEGYRSEIDQLKENKLNLEKELQAVKKIYNDKIEENKKLILLLNESSTSSSSSSLETSSSSSSSF